MPGDSNGARPRENVLPALPDAVRDQTSALSRHHTQGRLFHCSAEHGKQVLMFLVLAGSGQALQLVLLSIQAV